MKTRKLTQDLYWTGIIDRDLRVFDIIMYTEYGTTYNSYILKTKGHTILFETAKAKFFDDYLNELKEITDIKDIDYIVISHTEPDHSGSVEKLLEINPDIKIIATQTAINFLKEIVNHDIDAIAIKDGLEMTFDDKTLKFFFVPNLHWPDTMYTYIKEEGVLVTCDSFGAHYATEDILLSKVEDHESYMKASKYYFDNILGPFKPYMLKALDKIEGLDVKMICTGHGPIIDTDIETMMKIYREWSTVEKLDKKLVVIPYVSAYGYTKELAEVIAEGIKDSGDITVKLYDMVTADKKEVEADLLRCDGFLLGSPTILNDALAPIYEVTLSMYPPTHSGKIASAFGSYGWSGEAVSNLLARLKQLRMVINDEGFKVKFKPNVSDLKKAREFGYHFGLNILNRDCKI